MDLELTGKTAIVTGASRGIGRATARQLALEGCDVALCARTEGPLKQAAAELAKESGRRPRRAEAPGPALRMSDTKPYWDKPSPVLGSNRAEWIS